MWFQYCILLTILTRVIGNHETPMSGNQPMAVTPWGTYLGQTFRTRRQDMIAYAFTGIPYALPPVGDLRFRDPVQHESFSKPFNATNIPPECLQWDHLRGRGIVGNEDCLYLNIYTNRVAGPPNYPNTQPTLVFLHAGTWSAGSGASQIFQPDYFLEHNIAVVTVNHRIGPFGFLSTEDENAQGNYGLLDQVMALEWIRDNVRYFGGFNVSLAIMGSGSGGSSVHLLMMSPRLRPSNDEESIIGKAISHSGTAYSPHTISKNSKEVAIKFAINLNCPITDISLMMACLRSKDANVLVEKIPSLFEFDEEPIPFTPVIDTWRGENAFLPDEPFHLIKKRKILQIPWISGTNQNDGAFRVQDILKDKSLTSQLNNKWDKYGPILLHLTHSCKDPVLMARQIKKFYMGEKKFNDDNSKKFVEMMTDRFFLHPTYQAMIDHCSKSKSECYKYLFIYSGRKSFLDILHSESPHESISNTFGISNPRFKNTRDRYGWGVSFLDELLYLFPSDKFEMDYNIHSLGDEASSLSHILQILYTNFVIQGDPTPTLKGMPEDISPWNVWWEPYYPGSNYYLPIEPNMETQETIYRKTYLDFWNSLPLYENKDQNIIRDEL